MCKRKFVLQRYTLFYARFIRSQILAETKCWVSDLEISKKLTYRWGKSRWKIKTRANDLAFVLPLITRMLFIVPSLYFCNYHKFIHSLLFALLRFLCELILGHRIDINIVPLNTIWIIKISTLLDNLLLRNHELTK